MLVTALVFMFSGIVPTLVCAKMECFKISITYMIMSVFWGFLMLYLKSKYDDDPNEDVDYVVVVWLVYEPIIILLSILITLYLAATDLKINDFNIIISFIMFPASILVSVLLLMVTASVLIICGSIIGFVLGLPACFVISIIRNKFRREAAITDDVAISDFN